MGTSGETALRAGIRSLPHRRRSGRASVDRRVVALPRLRLWLRHSTNRADRRQGRRCMSGQCHLRHGAPGGRPSRIPHRSGAAGPNDCRGKRFRASGWGPLAPDLWRLGRLTLGRSAVVAVTARMLDQPGIILLLKAATCGTPITVLAPDPGPAMRLRYLEAGIDLVELRSALEQGPRGIDRLNQDALEPKSNGPRLSIQVATQAVLIDGRPQRVPSQPFNLLALLAQAVRDGRGAVRNRAIEDTTGRDARDLVRELRDALSADQAERVRAARLDRSAPQPRGL